MNLWIRTQNRMRLFNISLDVSVIGILDEKGNIDHYMIGCNDYEMDYELGIYKTKERALEVLSEIQDLLVPKLHHVCDRDLEGNEVKVLGLDYIQSIVYEMPLE